MGKPTKEDIEQAKERIRAYLPPVECGYHNRPKVYQIVRHVSKSGMSRDISTYVVDSSDGSLVRLDWAIGTLVGGLNSKRDGVRIGGCGMDMCFALLDHALHAAYAELPCNERPSANDYDRRTL